MTEKISRRDFLKLATVGATGTAILTGCGPASRYVKREPYTKMPEYTYNGLSTYYATSCRECAAGCGLIIRTMQGRALKVEGNPKHPLNLGKTCARGQVAVEGLYNPNRVTGPIKHKRGQALYDNQWDNIAANMKWDDAINVVGDALKDPGGVAFLMGLSPDHLFDLVTDLTTGISAASPIRYGVASTFETRATLSQAAQNLFGQAGLPFFDLGNSDLVISFGANFVEPWLSQVSYNTAYARMRRGNPDRRGYLIQFEPRMSQTASKADMWVPIVPGTEGQVALAIGRLVAEARGGTLPPVFEAVDTKEISQAAGVAMNTLQDVTNRILKAAAPLAIPGGSPLGRENGLATAQAILALNAGNNMIGKQGGVYLSPLAPTEDAYHRPASAQEMRDFIGKMKSGAIKVLFIHGVNPVFELPKSLGFEDALKNVGTVISFATFPDETAVAADYVFPDRHGLESWGYQRVATGSPQPALSGMQPVVTGVYPKDGNTELVYDARATADVLIAAAQAIGGAAAKALPYSDEVNFIQSQLEPLVGQSGGSFSAPDMNTFFASFQQYGGWWQTASALAAPTAADALAGGLSVPPARFAGEGEFFLLPFLSPTLGEAGANKPWLQQLADPTTTVMWNTWVEMNPDTAHKQGIENDDILRIVSEAGQVEAPVYLYPGIRPDTIGMPYGQGHTAYGGYAEGRGANLNNLLSANFNEAGDLAFAGMKVRVEKTGKKRELARMEGKLGVYGFTEEK
ncbi:MAG: molybdopterin-dependent oxidoreductase [Bacteroidota bacterium]